MDLALHMGMTTAGLRRAMTERELREWQAYAARRMLPQRRTELYLAQIALVVAKAMGGAKDATLGDFLFDPEDEPVDEPQGAADLLDQAKEFFGFAPRKG